MRSVLTWAVAAAFICGVAWAAPEAPAPEKKVEKPTGAREARPAGTVATAKEGEPEARAKAGPAMFFQRDLQLVEREYATIERDVQAQTNEEVKAAGEATLAAERKLIEFLKTSVAEAEKGEAVLGMQSNAQLVLLRSEKQSATRKYSTLKENQRYKEFAATSPDDAELQKLAEQLCQANLAILDLSTQLAQKNSEKVEATRAIEKRTGKRLTADIRTRTVAGKVGPAPVKETKVGEEKGEK